MTDKSCCLHLDACCGSTVCTRKAKQLFSQLRIPLLDLLVSCLRIPILTPCSCMRRSNNTNARKLQPVKRVPQIDTQSKIKKFVHFKSGKSRLETKYSSTRAAGTTTNTTVDKNMEMTCWRKTRLQGYGAQISQHTK